MIAHLSLLNFGAHADTTVALDPKGTTTIVGPSESGKSDLVAARDRAARAGLEAAAAELRAERAEEVLGIVRAAPGEALRGKLAALEGGPVVLRVPDDGDAIEVLVTPSHGGEPVPWSRASTGRRIVACMDFRARLRAAVKLGWVPLFVDEVQSVGGQPLPAVAGPVVLLRTVADGALRVAEVTP